MNVTDLAALVGRHMLFDAGQAFAPCTVLNVRLSYGHPQALIALPGKDTRWVLTSRLSPLETSTESKP